jgi:predicted nucleic acid-binding Zn ribbon protein
MREYHELKKYCVFCEQPFKATRDDAQYCSTRCRTAAHRQRNKPTLAQALDQDEREDLWYVRDLSSLAYKLIQTTYDRHGLNAAKLAINIALAAYENKDVTRAVTSGHFGVVDYQPGDER